MDPYIQIGEAVTKIASKLTEDKELIKLLINMSDDPLNEDLNKNDDFLDFQFGIIRTIPKVKFSELKRGTITIVPYYGATGDNSNFSLVGFNFNVFLPIDKWQINSLSQRPYLIMSRLYQILNNSRVTGIGTLRHEGFELDIISDEISLHTVKFSVDAVG